MDARLDPNVWIEVKGENLVCFEHSDRYSGTRNKTLVFGQDDRIWPIMETRENKGETGKDCYEQDVLEKATLIVKIEVDANGEDRSAIYVKKNANIAPELVQLIKKTVWNMYNYRYLSMLLRKVEKMFLA